MTVERLEACAEQSAAGSAGTLHVDVREYAVLSDGRRLLLTDDRGWSASGPPLEVIWASLTVADLERDVLNVVLPDDAEQTGDEHSWDVLAQALARHGVVVGEDDLRRVPYVVVLGDTLLARLSAT